MNTLGSQTKHSNGRARASVRGDSATIQRGAKVLSVSAREVFFSVQSGSHQIEILHGVSLDVRAGELVAIMGPSGCGKSTLLAMLGGLAQPTSGEVKVLGSPLHDLTPDTAGAFRLRNIAMVFQDFNLVSSLTVIENCALPLEVLGVPRSEARSRSLKELDEMGLAVRADDFPDDLSGGERQRVAIARSLAGGHDRVLLADEPTGSLDSRSTELVLDVIAEKFDCGVIVTHDDRVAQRADRVVRMLDGRMAE